MKEYISFAQLRKLLKEEGLPASKITLMRWEKKGILKLAKAPQSGWRRIEKSEIPKILKAFSPGGKGYYYYDKS